MCSRCARGARAAANSIPNHDFHNDWNGPDLQVRNITVLLRRVPEFRLDRVSACKTAPPAGRRTFLPEGRHN